MRRTTGFSLMLLIFLSLCLMVFSLLSLSGASADETLSRKAADRTTEYYAAASKAHEILAQIDVQLADFLKTAEASADPEASYPELCAGIREALPDITWKEAAEEKDTLSFEVSVTQDQVLEVSISAPYPSASDDTLYRITGWQIRNTADWTPDTSQKVYRTDAR